MTKEERYEALAERVRKCGQMNAEGKCMEGKQCCNSGRDPKLVPYKECDEINLWTYWQGGKRHLNTPTKILLAGQDWGSMDTEVYEEARIVENIVQKRKENPDEYLSYTEGNNNPTDKNLIELFKSIDPKIDITKDCPSIFFTNFVLCYRADAKISGDYKTTWGNNCGRHFKELVDILEPKVILCLGKSVYKGVMKALGGTVKEESYNCLLDRHEPSIVNGYTIFPLAHCGGMGTSNRNRDKDKHKDILHYQKEDWAAIKKYL